MNHLPIYAPLVFTATTLLTIFLFYRASFKNKKVLAVVLLWLALQTVLGISGFFTVTDTIPPRFALLILPPLLLAATIFLTARGRHLLTALILRHSLFCMQSAFL